MEVVGDYDTVEPLRLCIPLRIAVPLKLEILKTDSNFNEADIIFTGTVREPRLEGRRVRVTCVEWGDAMDAKVPNFFIQRDCNYRVYDANTCRANRTTKEVAVNITASSGRSATIQGAGLAGLAADWFAHGWIETGSGLNRQVRFVTASGAASGTSVAVTVNEPFDVEVPVSATAIPGCDGRRTTCDTKFSNLVNFGGHETPRDNLAVAVLKTESPTTGKK